MHIIIWEYRVRAEKSSEFEKIYGEHGLWAELFQHGKGYLGTELLVASSNPYHYATIDRWASVIDYEVFLANWQKEYEKLDTQFEGLIEQETLVGKWDSIPHTIP